MVPPLHAREEEVRQNLHPEQGGKKERLLSLWILLPEAVCSPCLLGGLVLPLPHLGTDNTATASPGSNKKEKQSQEPSIYWWHLIPNHCTQGFSVAVEENTFIFHMVLHSTVVCPMFSSGIYNMNFQSTEKHTNTSSISGTSSWSVKFLTDPCWTQEDAIGRYNAGVTRIPGLICMHITEVTIVNVYTDETSSTILCESEYERNKACGMGQRGDSAILPFDYGMPGVTSALAHRALQNL